jgi:small conductance mechanosensitive channel
LTLAKFFARAVRWAILIAIGLSVLSAFGIETTSFAAFIAAGGLAVGLALQGALSSFAAGLLLLAFRPFTVGDVIRAAGEVGTVNAISLFTTKLDTSDNRRLFIPNNAVIAGNIENVSHHTERRADVPVGTEYGADIDRTRQVLETAAASVDGRLAEPPPQVGLAGLGGSSVDWEV